MPGCTIWVSEERKQNLTKRRDKKNEGNEINKKKLCFMNICLFNGDQEKGRL